VHALRATFSIVTENTICIGAFYFDLRRTLREKQTHGFGDWLPVSPPVLP
jgi:hypothetical protein